MTSPVGEPPSPTDGEEAQPDQSRLDALIPLTQNLAKSVTCPICLEYMQSAKQLQCGHLFCSSCITSILTMPQQRCAVCKEKTGKRMIRSPPLPFDQILQTLSILDSIVKDTQNTQDKQKQNSNHIQPNQQQDENVQRAMKRIEQIHKAQVEKTQKLLEQPNLQKSVTESEVEITFGRYCRFCPKGVSTSYFTDQKVEFGGVFKIPPTSKTSKPSLIHEFCALYSDGVFQVDDDQLENVERCYTKTRGIVCSRDACGRDHANVPCAYETCGKSYHFPCAIVENGLVIEDGYKYYCPTHKAEAPVIDENEFKNKLGDPTDDVSMRHELYCYICNNGGRLLMCDTCDRVVHPACTGLKAIPIGDWSCGICTGEHKQSIYQSAQKRKSIQSQETPPSASIKRKRTNHIQDDVDTQQNTQSRRSRRSSESNKRYVLAHSGLKTSQRDLLSTIAKARKTLLKGDIDTRVTHMIVSADTPQDIPRRTMKVCKAIACRTPLVCWKWVEESVKNDLTWIPIDNYIHPLTWTDSKSIFEGKRFYFGCFTGAKDMREDLINLVQLGGATIVYHEPTAGNDMSQNPILYVFQDETGRSRRDSTNRSQIPTDATAITSSWILDQCTKNRASL